MKKYVQGWQVVDASGFEDESKTKCFLSVDEALKYRAEQDNPLEYGIELQYIEPEWAEDFRKSRPKKKEYER